MKVVVLGKGLMLANIILGVLDAGADIVGVFRYDQTCTNKLKLMFNDFFKPAPEVTLIKERKLKEIRLKSANSTAFKNLMISLNVDLIIIGTWKEQIKPEIYNVPQIATVNVHPSLLPKYRGPNPYMQTILHGEEFSGVTIHLVNDRYDAGAILKQQNIPIYNTDTSKELRERTTRAARDLVYEFITDLNEKILTPVMQDDKYATYYPNITGEEMMLDFALQTSEEISRTIRALHPFLPTYITYKKVFFCVDPYNFQILDETVDYLPDSIISKDPETKSLTIVCKDLKPVKFSNLKLYKRNDTKKYIQKNVEITK
ncbi:MAG: formyltransferase family protein [Cyanobacteriota bacterium]|nr:formyltransferase family protein [Cyanobacteriota bacterium]MDY6359389.1 formyltransferase family protein [Cyanobacteriota bacterium]MDY6364926.1 formyltransferase family protein [Cyanobacteriota bacterium]MDY6382867.1 formyltransferase family protein [Cyanobacteriota bacterium]